MAASAGLHRAAGQSACSALLVCCAVSALQNPDAVVGMVLDLTNSDKYYDPMEFTANNVRYCKVSQARTSTKALGCALHRFLGTQGVCPGHAAACIPFRMKKGYSRLVERGTTARGFSKGVQTMAGAQAATAAVVHAVPVMQWQHLSHRLALAHATACAETSYFLTHAYSAVHALRCVAIADMWLRSARDPGCAACILLVPCRYPAGVVVSPQIRWLSTWLCGRSARPWCHSPTCTSWCTAHMASTDQVGRHGTAACKPSTVDVRVSTGALNRCAELKKRQHAVRRRLDIVLRWMMLHRAPSHLCP